MKIWTKLVAMGCLLALVLMVCPATGEKAPPPPETTAIPVLTVTGPALKAGPVLEGDPVPFTVRIRNTGAAPLNIVRLRPWRGTKITAFDQVLAPGADGRIALEFKTLDAAGDTQRGVTVLTNEPRDVRRRRIAVALTVTPQITVAPNRVFLTGFAGDDLSREIIIQGNLAGALALTSPESQPADLVDFSLKKTETAHRLSVRNRNLTPGSRRGRIVLKTNFPQKPKVVVPVFVRILETVEAIPKKVDFGRVERRLYVSPPNSGGDPRPLPKKTVFLRANRGASLKIKKVEVSHPGFEAQVRAVEPGRIYRVDITARVTDLTLGEASTVIDVSAGEFSESVIRIPTGIVVK